MGQGGTADGVVAQTPRPRRARPIVALAGTAGDVVVFALVSLLLWTALPVIGLQASPRVVDDASMAPVIRAGDVLLTVTPEDPAMGLLAPGAIVVTAEAGEPGVHRIVATGIDDYEVRGDRQGFDETRTIDPSVLVGVGRFLVPAIGLPVHWVRTQRWGTLAGSLLGLLGALVMSSTGQAAVAAARRRSTAPARLPQRVPGAQHPVVLAASRRDATIAAERAAMAARAAQRGAHALPGLDERRAAEREAARARDERGSGAGHVVGGLLVLALSIVGFGTSSPAFALMEASSVNVGSHVSVAAAPDEQDEPGELLTVFTLPAYDGEPSIAAGQQDEIFVFPIPVAATQRLDGPVRTALLLAPSTPGDPERTVEVALLLDGVVVASDTQRFRATDPQPAVRTGTLQGAIDGLVVGPGDRLELRITLRRVELLLDPGPSTITFAGPD